jgi:hypothetical protein
MKISLKKATQYSSTKVERERAGLTFSVCLVYIGSEMFVYGDEEEEERNYMTTER